MSESILKSNAGGTWGCDSPAPIGFSLRGIVQGWVGDYASYREKVAVKWAERALAAGKL